MSDGPSRSTWDKFRETYTRHASLFIAIIVALVTISGMTWLGVSQAPAVWWLIGCCLYALLFLVVFVIYRFVVWTRRRAWRECWSLISSAFSENKSGHGGLVIVKHARKFGKDLLDGTEVTRQRYMEMLKDSLRECTMYFSISRLSPRELLDQHCIVYGGKILSVAKIAEAKQNGKVRIARGVTVTKKQIEAAENERKIIVEEWRHYFDMQVKRAEEVGWGFQLWRVFVFGMGRFKEENEHVNMPDGSTCNYWRELVDAHSRHKAYGFKASYYSEEQAAVECQLAKTQISVFGKGANRWAIEFLGNVNVSPASPAERLGLLSPIVKVKVHQSRTIYNTLSIKLFPQLEKLRAWEIHHGQDPPRESEQKLDLMPIYGHETWWGL